MIFVRFRDWMSERSERERRLIWLMLAVAVPILAWALIVRPLSNAYDATLEKHLQAVDRNGRVRALAQVAKDRTAAPAAVAVADLGLAITESAGQAGLALDGNAPAGGDVASISIAQASPAAAIRWFQDLQARGLIVEEWRMSPAGSGTVTVTARVRRPS